jgi:hypothetical protein
MKVAFFFGGGKSFSWKKFPKEVEDKLMENDVEVY